MTLQYILSYKASYIISLWNGAMPERLGYDISQNKEELPQSHKNGKTSQVTTI